MLVVRLVNQHDVDAILDLAKQSEGALPSLPADKHLLQHKIEHCLASLQKAVQSPGDEYYFFVLEDLAQHKLVGCCAIKAAIGLHEPAFVYHIAKLKHVSQQLSFSQTLHLLELVNDFEGTSELCSLYLSPTYRNNHNKELLSWSRLLFIAQFAERFSKHIMADIRGMADAEHNSIFWQAIGSKVFPLDYATAYYLSGFGPTQFIADLIPRAPIYMELLPKEVQQVIGQPHPTSKAAMNMLLAQGFHYQEYVNILDAGPTVDAFTNNILAITQSKVSKVAGLATAVSGQLAIVTNTQLQFRAILTSIQLTQDQTIVLAPEAAESLQVNVGNSVRWYSLE